MTPAIDPASFDVDGERGFLPAQWEANPATVSRGGTPFIPYLSKHRDETLGHLLSRHSLDRAT